MFKRIAGGGTFFPSAGFTRPRTGSPPSHRFPPCIPLNVRQDADNENLQQQRRDETPNLRLLRGQKRVFIAMTQLWPVVSAARCAVLHDPQIQATRVGPPVSGREPSQHVGGQRCGDGEDVPQGTYP